ncbi:MAG: enoyl-CoA hydratase/isomerase family protein [Chloroflexota bacterium]
MEHLLLEFQDRVATVTLNDPERRNPLGSGAIRELAAVLRQCDADAAVGIIVITGAGSSFSAGADLKEFHASLEADAYEHWAAGEPWADLFRLVPSLGKPVVASVGGHALAGGCGLVALCDLAIAAEGATFGTPEINIGLFPLFIFPALARAVGRRHAVDLCLTGHRIDAQEAHRIGLVSRVVPAAQLRATTAELAAELAGKPARAMRLGKYALYRMAELDYDQAIDFARTIRGTFLAGEELRRGTGDFLDRGKKQ